MQADTKSKAHPADVRRSLSKSAARNPSRAVSNVEWGSILEETDEDVLQELGELEDNDIPPNDDPLDSDDDDSSQNGNWPAFQGDIGDYWDDSSNDGDFQ